MFVEHLSRKLDLTQQQRTEVEKILERRRARVEAIRANAHKEIDETNAEIEKVLTPEQRKKFDELKMKMAGRGEHFPRP
jgi:Spy/CpxP family protein refolding chaperone